MILACPLCQTRYLVPASLFAAGPRQVRCAKCSHAWRAELPKEIDAVPPANLAAMPESAPRKSPPPLPPGVNLPAVRDEPWPRKLRLAVAGGVAVAVLALLLWLIFDRKGIIESFPSVAAIYDTLGLHVYYPGEGLTLDGVRSEVNYQDGATRLIVEGKIRNTTASTLVIPDIAAEAIGPDGGVMQSWRIDAPAAKLEAGSLVPFHSTIKAPKGTVVNVNLSFAEPKYDTP